MSRGGVQKGAKNTSKRKRKRPDVGGAQPSRVTGDKKKSGLIRKYGLNMSRQAFRENAEAIGFKKVRCII